jgi:hypothetical protein
MSCSRVQAGAQNSQSAAPRKTADNAQTVGFCWGKASFLFGYVGNLTDSRHDESLEWDYGGAAMAHYDPETLIILRKALDEAWAAMPDSSKSVTLKSEMAQRILKQAADGMRDPVGLRASSLVSAPGEPKSTPA